MSWLDSFKNWLNAPRAEANAAACYGDIVAQARQPGFYTRMLVADTPQGRFELVMLHAALVMARLQENTAFNQALFDLMFADFDVNLRELGVGDLGVGKRVHSWAEAFHGRAVAYNAALKDRVALADALARNIDMPADRAITLAAYVQLAALTLHESQEHDITQGHFLWPIIETKQDDTDRSESAA